MSEDKDVWGQAWAEHMGIPANSNEWFFANNMCPDVVVTGSFSPTKENVGLMQKIWRAAFADGKSRDPVFLPQAMNVQRLRAKVRCRYCKSIVHGDTCSTCGAPQ